MRVLMFMLVMMMVVMPFRRVLGKIRFLFFDLVIQPLEPLLHTGFIFG